MLSVDTVLVKGDVSPHWRLTSLVNQDAYDEPGFPFAVLLQNAVGAPGSTMIAVDPGVGNSVELRLRQLSNGSWDNMNCCSPLGTPLPGETRVRLGVSPSQTVPVGPFFAGFGISRFSQDPNLGSGTMSGQNVLGTFTYNVAQQGPQLGPTAVLRLDGTRNGAMMTGTIIVTVWELGNSNPPTVGPAEHYRFPFTAVRIR